MPNDEIYRHAVVSTARYNEVGVTDGRVDEIVVRTLHKTVVLHEHTFNRATALGNIPLQPPAQSYVIYDLTTNYRRSG